jgi:cytochrome c biogenesis protein CcmG/thiol:disulfide interchange protein DsbE
VLLGLALAILATIAVIVVVNLGRPSDSSGLIAKDQPAPAVVGTTLDGQPFDLASLRGRPVILNFWGPSCVPCREEFPLFKAKLAEHAGDGLAIVGVLTFDPPSTARDFIDEFGATWPTIDDPDGAIRRAYRVAARPQTYFIDSQGILRAIQVGQVLDSDFEQIYASIAP